ncbi:hypothetical protein D3C84_857600 [compost metagenome]
MIVRQVRAFSGQVAFTTRGLDQLVKRVITVRRLRLCLLIFEMVHRKCRIKNTNDITYGVVVIIQILQNRISRTPGDES